MSHLRLDAHSAWHARSDFIAAVTGRSRDAGPPARAASVIRDGFELAAMHYDLPSDLGSGSWELLRLAPDLIAVRTSTTYAHRIDVLAPGEGFLEFHYRLSGRMYLDGDDGAAGIDLDRPCLLVQRQSPGAGVVEHIEAGRHDSSVTIYVRPSALYGLLACARADLPDPLRTMCLDNDAGVRRYRTILTPTLAAPVVTLASAEMHDAFGLIRAEALVRLALCEVVGAFGTAHPGSSRTEAFASHDVTCLRRARAILQHEHAPPPTIATLARAVGLSGTRLKVGFRQLFGTSVNAYAAELRLRDAFHLLERADVSFGRIAQYLGFQHQSAFNAFFRRHVGQSPSEFRQLCRSEAIRQRWRIQAESERENG